MNPGIQRLRMLKVRDVMSRHVVEVSANQSMSRAAISFAESGVTSAPVINEVGLCVGMLSASDFMKWSCPDCGETRQHTLVRDNPGECYSIEPSSDMVRTYMSPAVQSVAADESLLQAARTMCVAHIHHLPVLENDRPVGVVSIMDIAAALVTAIDEVDAALN
jgi:CBS domain-containing protein